MYQFLLVERDNRIDLRQFRAIKMCLADRLWSPFFVYYLKGMAGINTINRFPFEPANYFIVFRS